MKKFIIFLLLTLSSFNGFAQDIMNAVTMEGYSQGWLDSKATIRLKNNTKEDIENVGFVLTYYDMNGTMLDYKEFAFDVDIAPGLTKAVDIESFEHARNASYYKSEAKITRPYKFDVKFELKGYNMEEDSDSAEEDEFYTKHDNDDGKGGFLFLAGFIFLILLVLAIGFALCVIPAVMAQHRGRNPILWFLLGIVTTPLLAIILLLVLGYDNPQNEHYSS